MSIDDMRGLAIFQMTALPTALSLIAYCVLPSRKPGSQTTDSRTAGINDNHFQWLGRKLFIPPVAFIFSGALSYAFPRIVMGSLGVTLFLTLWYWIILLASFRQRVQSDLDR